MTSYRTISRALLPLFVLAAAAATGSTAHAQERSRHADVWTFGHNCRMAWNADATVVTQSQDPSMFTGEGCASFANPQTGQLLIYTDGIRVWDPSGAVIISNLPGDDSSLHSGVIVPVPGTPGQVYVFGHQAGASSNVGYRRFDVTNGVVAIGSTNSTVDLGASAGREGMVVVPHANGIDYWLMISGATKIFVLPITSSGVGAPVATDSQLSVWTNGWHLFAISHQGDRLAMSGNFDVGGPTSPIATWDFDNATGILSNRTDISNTFAKYQYYGGTFSPSGHRLYFATLDESNVNSGPSGFYQYDFDNAVFTTLHTSSTRYSHGDARLAPDGKIYVAGSTSANLDVINFPDAAGAAAGYVADAIAPPAGCVYALGLPQSPSPLFKVDLDLSVNILGPSGSVTVSSVTPSGSAQAPDGAVVTVVATDPSGGTLQCTATVQSAAWTCSTPFTGLVGGAYTMVATVTSGNDSATDDGAFCATGPMPFSPAGAACLLSIGCADGSREGYVDTSKYPIIASCGGAWDEPGVFHDAPQCERAAGNDGLNEAGTGCNVEDLCAAGWHVCHGPDDVDRRTGGRGCTDAIAADYPSNGSQTPTVPVPPGGAFFVGRTSGPGNGICDEVVNGLPANFNDIFGCGNIGSPANANCAPLNKFGNNQCGGLVNTIVPYGYTTGEAAWACNDGTNGFHESQFATKKRPDDQGGVMCCKDNDASLPELCDGVDNNEDGVIDEVAFDDDGIVNDQAGDRCAVNGGFGSITCTTDGSWTCTQEICDDLIDNDQNGYVDVYDPACQPGELQCTVPVTPAAFTIKKARETNGAYEDLFWPITGDVDGDGKTEILASSSSTGTINVLDGATLTVESTIAINGDRGDVFAIANLDGDPQLEVISLIHSRVGAELSNRMFVADYNPGTNTWVTNVSAVDVTAYNCAGNVGSGLGLGFADFNGDGRPEIFYGNEIWSYPDNLATGCTGCVTKLLDADVDATADAMHGCLIVTGESNSQGAVSVVEDVLSAADCAGDRECDGPELIVAGQVFSVDIAGDHMTLRRDVNTFGAGTGYGDGFTAVADLDNDGDLDVAVAGNAPGGNMYAYDPKSKEVLQVWSLPGKTGHAYSLITIADVFDEDLADDGDSGNDSVKNVPELIATRVIVGPPISGALYAANVSSAAPIWTLATTDSSGSTATTVFDFNGDGILELAYRDEQQMRVMYGGPMLYAPNGVDASTRNYAAFPCTSATMNEGPTVADVDDNGAAELVVVCGNAPGARLTIFESNSTPWREARHVWNQPNFNPGAIDEDGRVYPVAQARNAYVPEGSSQRPLNVALAQNSPLDYRVRGGDVVAAIDASITEVSVVAETACTVADAELDIQFTLNNDGDTLITGDLQVALYTSAPGAISPALVIKLSDASLIGGQLPIAAGASATFAITIDSGPAPSLWLVANNDGAGFPVAECDTSNNSADDIACVSTTCDPTSTSVPAVGCDASAPYCVDFFGAIDCVACIDDTAGGGDTGCSGATPSCNPVTHQCETCAGDPECAAQGSCEDQGETSYEFAIDEGCSDDGRPEADLFVVDYTFCEAGCEGVPYGALSIIIGNRGLIDANQTLIAFYDGNETLSYFFETGPVPSGGTTVATVFVDESFWPTLFEVVSLNQTPECDYGNNVGLLPFAPLFTDLDNDQIADVCDDCIAGQNPEICDGEDNDCDGGYDEGCDDDDDGFCDATMECVAQAVGEVCPNGCGDCDDTVITVYPGALETCNGVNDDCDGATDEGIAPVPTTCGVGACFATGTSTCSGGRFVDACVPGTPAANDAVCNGVDDDCAGGTDEDYEPRAIACTQCQVAESTRCDQGHEVFPPCLPREDGIICQGHQCALASECQAGSCVATRIRACDDGNPCTSDACDPQTGCVASVLENGSECSDKNGCTTGDTCEGGVCGGTGVVCAVPQECERPGVCNPATGVCDYGFVEGCVMCGSDDAAPVLSCPAAPEAVQCTQGGTAVSLGAPSARDLCSGVSIASDAPNLYPGGVTIVTYTATDAAGNSSACSVPVTVEDTEPPEIFCQEITTVQGDPGTCGAIVTVRPSVVDDCDGTEVTLAGMGVDGAFFPPGPTDVLITAIDAAGNQATCATVIDVVGLDDFSIDCEETVEKTAPDDFCGWPEALTADVVDECDSIINVTSETEAFPIGDTDVVFTASRDDGKSDTCTTRLTVVDTTKPVVDCGHPDVQVDLAATFVPAVYDACSAEVVITNAGCVRVTDGSDVAVSERCDVLVEDEATVVVTDAPPSGDGAMFVVYTVTATDPSGNVTELDCRAPVDPESLDHDKDGVIDRDDNCIDTPNTDQVDTNFDGEGDACDELIFDGIEASGGGGCGAGAGAGWLWAFGLGLFVMVRRTRRARS